MEFINWILMQKSDYSSKRVQDFPEIDVESSCLGFGPPVLAVVGWISSGIPPIITLNKIMMMVLMMRMAMKMFFPHLTSNCPAPTLNSL